MDKPQHAWLSNVRLAVAPGPMTPLLESTLTGILRHFRLQGHQVLEAPDDGTGLILTTACFGEPIPWREAPLFVGRKLFNLSRIPTVYTLVHARPADFQQVLARLSNWVRMMRPTLLTSSPVWHLRLILCCESRYKEADPSSPWSAWCRRKPRASASYSWSATPTHSSLTTSI